MTTVDLAGFLLARIAEDEAAARAAADGAAPTWEHDGDGDVYSVIDLTSAGRCDQHPTGVPNMCDDLPVASGQDIRDYADVCQARAVHIARHDPARVLAECAAKRKIVELHSCDHGCPDASGMDDYIWVTAPRNATCATLRLLAQPHAEHPECDPEWRVEV